MVQFIVAETLGLRSHQVIIHSTLVGGGFGRRIEIDYAIQAVQIAKHFKQPVKLVWSREEDISRGYFRPKTVIQVKAGLDQNGAPLAFSFTAASPNLLDYSIEGRHFDKSQADESALANATDWPYAVGARKIGLTATDLLIPVCYMRSVGSVASQFALESFLDDMAKEAKSDPIDYRRLLLKDRPRELAVINKAALLADWGQPMPAGHHRGFALHAGNGSVVAQIIEIELLAERRVKLHRITCVVDCGIALNPDAVTAQMEGGIIFGLSGALFGEITVKDGAVLQKNFDSYPLLTLAQTPHITVEIVTSDAPVGGVGEEAVPPVAAALANALFAATGERVRSLPLQRHGFRFV
jgi:isoquinoline 1-oxidoreductase beta subunit